MLGGARRAGHPPKVGPGVLQVRRNEPEPFTMKAPRHKGASHHKVLLDLSWESSVPPHRTAGHPGS
jgi:hypothetical protein